MRENLSPARAQCRHPFQIGDLVVRSHGLYVIVSVDVRDSPNVCICFYFWLGQSGGHVWSNLPVTLREGDRIVR